MFKQAKSTEDHRKEVLDFLSADFGEAFSQLREYDTRIWDVTKFTFLELLAGIGAVWTIFTVANGDKAPAPLTPVWELVGAILLIISFLFSFLAVHLVLRTRVYFVRVARYINAQRHFYFSLDPSVYPNESKYYTRFDKPEYNDADSTELWSVYAINVVSSFVFGLGVGLLANYFKMPNVPSIVLGIVVWLVFTVLEVTYSHWYLSREDKHPEQIKDRDGG